MDKINNGRREVSVELRASFDDSSQDLQKGLNQLWQSVQPAKPPETIEDQFKIIKP